MLAVWLGFVFLRGSQSNSDPANAQAAFKENPISGADESPLLNPSPQAAAEASELLGQTSREVLGVSDRTVLEGRVSSQGIQAVEGATVTWSRWDDSFLDSSLASVELLPALVEAYTLTTTTDALGSYQFDRLPPGSETEVSVLWVTHPDFLATSKLLEPSSSPTQGSTPRQALDFVLSSSGSVAVEVFLGANPAPEAHVIQQISFPHGTPAAYAGGENLPKSDLLFLRRYDWHPGAPLDIAPLGVGPTKDVQYKQRLFARSEHRLSKSYRGPDQDLIRLELQPTFEVFGSVLPPLPETIAAVQWTDGQWGQARVVISALRGTLEEELGSLSINREGDFGPDPIPWVKADIYRATLVGNDFIPQPESFATPQPEDAVELQLQAELGSVLWLKAETPEQNAIPFPWATLRWEHKGARTIRRFAGRSDSFIALTGVPDGIAEGAVSAEGYDSVDLGSLLSPASVEQAGIVTLSPVVPLRGRCLSGAEPVSDFEIRFWDLDNPDQRGSLQVEGSQDGSFVVPNPTSGDLVLCAIAEDYSISPEVIVSSASLDSDQEVLLFVEPPGTMVGRLLDAQTHAPLGEGSVTVYATHSLEEMDPIGPPSPVTSDGRFQIPRLVGGCSIVSFDAPSHSVRELKVWYDGKSDVELGDVELDGTQSLHATLLLPDGQDPSGFVLVADGIGAILPTPFDANGELLIPDVNGGAFEFAVYPIEAVGFKKPQLAQSTWLRAGESWDLRFDLCTGREVLLSIPMADRDQEDLLCFAAYDDETGAGVTQIAAIDDAGTCSLSGLPPGLVTFTIEDEYTGMVRGMKLVDLPPGDGPPISVTIEPKVHPVTVRVVDPSGAPQQEVYVEIATHRDSQSAILAGGTTDEMGLCEFPTLLPEADSALLLGPEAGLNFELPFRIPSDAGEVVDLIFDRGASIQLHITDEGIPQPTATVRLWSLGTDGRVLIPGRSPDAGGNLTLSNLGPGTYELRVTGSGFWPLSLSVEATHEGRLYQVSARRLGAADLRFLDAQGAPLANSSIELLYLPTGETVSAWINEARLMTPLDALITDDSGRLLLQAVPHGTYRWSVGDSTGLLDIPIEGTIKNVIQLGDPAH